MKSLATNNQPPAEPPRKHTVNEHLMADLAKFKTVDIRVVKEALYQAKKEKVLRLNRASFWKFCKTKNKDFYKEDREHLKKLCDVMQKLKEGKLRHPKTGKIVKKIMINMPPRFGKSSTATCFVPWVLGKDNSNRVISVSYNEILSSRFGKATRNHIQESSINPTKITYNDIFPTTKVQRGDASGRLWSLEEQYFNYLATSPGGTATGVGANIGIIDDLIKNHKEAFNNRILEEHWEWYTNTFLSRLEAGAIQIIIMTRWATKDLCGRLLELEKDEWYELRFEAYDNKTKKLLCPEILPLDEYFGKKKRLSNVIFLANYHQLPVDLKGKLYKKLKTYDPKKFIKFEKIVACCDTADQGADYLAFIIFGVYQGDAYILNIYYTEDDMTITEPEVARRLMEYKVDLAIIEANNGGHGFARNVRRELEALSHYGTVIEEFNQRDNKEARIKSMASYVMRHILFQEGWQDEDDSREFAEEILGFNAKGKNPRDDGADCLTLVAEYLEDGIDSWSGWAA